MTFRFRLPAALAVACAMVFGAAAHAQTATLLKDINTTVDVSFSSEPDGLVDLNGVGYFFASSSPGVRGLWRTDGTTAGTRLVKERLDGRHLTASGGKLFFIGNDAIRGSELWTSDGTTAGTVLVKDIGAGPVDGVSPNNGGLLAIDGTAYFVAGDFAVGLTLWKSDGTEAGSAALLSVDPELPSPIGLLGGADGVAYFFANDAVNGSELWSSDGTVAGTTMLRDINPGSGSSFPGGGVSIGGRFLFNADDGSHGRELWGTDGSPMGTTMVMDLNPGSESGLGGSLHVFKNRVYFIATNGDDAGLGLWSSDGTATGVERILIGFEPSSLTNVAGTLYFIERGGFGGDDVLWKTEGTMAGTAVLKKFAGPSALGLTSFGGALFLAADDGLHGYELWKTDGTEAGTVIVRDINTDGSSHPNNLAALRRNPLTPGELLFVANDGAHGAELWKTNGSEAGTVLVRDIGIGVGSSNPDRFLLGGAGLLFAADDGLGRSMWQTDGEKAGTVKVDNFDPSALAVNGFYVFNDGVNGTELWRTSEAGGEPVMVKDINPSPGVGSSPDWLTDVRGILFFSADDGVNGQELWKSDGTASGTVMVRNIHPAEGRGSGPSRLFDHNGVLYFTAQGPVSSAELWKSNGTQAGTERVTDLTAAAGSFRNPVTSGNLLFFLTWHPAGGYRLWRTDGTESGTFILKALGATFGPQPELTDVNGRLVFSVQQGISSLRQGSLWRSDGTVEGTVSFRTFEPVPDSDLTVTQFTSYNSGLYFLVKHPTGRADLWKTDGTESGTARVGDLPPPVMSINRILGAYAGSLFLDVQEGTDSSSDHHIARTQGTPATTFVDDAAFLDDANVYGGLEPFTGVGAKLYFGATTEETGRELWVLPLLPAISAAGVVDAAGYLPTLAPGGLASLFGVELAGSTASAASFPLPTTLAGAKVKVNGIDAPLLFVSPTQINFQVPYGTPLGAGVSVVAWLNGQQSLSQPTAVAEFAPAIFVNPSTGEPIVQRHPDGALITAQNPAKPGDTLILYVTGIGGLDNPPPTGAAATTSPLATATATPTVLVGGVEATALFAGLVPGFAGLGQINIVLPPSLPQGAPLPLTIHFGASESSTLALPF